MTRGEELEGAARAQTPEGEELDRAGNGQDLEREAPLRGEERELELTQGGEGEGACSEQSE